MRGDEKQQSEMFHYFSVEDRIPSDHPLREIRKLCDRALARLSGTFDTMYSDIGRPSIAPETVLKSLILMALYSVRSERQLCEQINYNVLFRWFLGMSMSSPAFDPTVFGKNRDRLIEHEVGKEFLSSVVEEAKLRKFISEEHFSVDGTLLEAWASMKSFVPKDTDDDQHKSGGGSNRWVDFQGEKRSNKTHASKTDPNARLMRKGPGKEAKLSYCSNVAMENRNGLIVKTLVKHATGTAETEAALEMLDALKDEFSPTSCGADKGYHNKHFVQGCRTRGIAPHAAQVSGWHVAGLDRRTTCSGAYKASQKVRMRIEEQFGWGKTIGGLRKLKLRGVDAVGFVVDIVSATFDMLRIARLSTT